MSNANIIELVCRALMRDDKVGAASIARERYPFVAHEKARRVYTAYQMTGVFWRDGFIDRYSGERLVFPGTLRVLGAVLPAEFPAHPSWKMSASHIVYWQLFPTIDHVVPVSRGGTDDAGNWVSTSMLRNSAKAHWTLQELSWTLHPPGSPDVWDGLMHWFVEYTETRSELCQSPYVRRWRAAAIRVMQERSG